MLDSMNYIQELAGEIGPRPVSTEEEHQSAQKILGWFQESGTPATLEEFHCPVSTGWPYGFFYLLAIVATVLTFFRGVVAIIALVIAVITLACFLYERFFGGDFGSVFKKGISQNVVAQHIPPRANEGGRSKKIVIVAHYDSERAAVESSPIFVNSYPLMRTLVLVSMVALPVLMTVQLLPFATDLIQLILWIVCCIFSIAPLCGLLGMIARKVVLRDPDGANNNASGVAVMMSVHDAIVAQSSRSRGSETGASRPVTRSSRKAYEAGVVTGGTRVEYENERGFGQETTVMPPVGSPIQTDIPKASMRSDLSPQEAAAASLGIPAEKRVADEPLSATAAVAAGASVGAAVAGAAFAGTAAASASVGAARGGSKIGSGAVKPVPRKEKSKIAFGEDSTPRDRANNAATQKTGNAPSWWTKVEGNRKNKLDEKEVEAVMKARSRFADTPDASYRMPEPEPEPEPQSQSQLVATGGAALVSQHAMRVEQNSIEEAQAQALASLAPQEPLPVAAPSQEEQAAARAREAELLADLGQTIGFTPVSPFEDEPVAVHIPEPTPVAVHIPEPAPVAVHIPEPAPASIEKPARTETLSDMDIPVSEETSIMWELRAAAQQTRVEDYDDLLPESKPFVASVPEMTPEAMPEVTPEAMPDVRLEGLSTVMTEPATTVMPEAAPKADVGYRVADISEELPAFATGRQPAISSDVPTARAASTASVSSNASPSRSLLDRLPDVDADASGSFSRTNKVATGSFARVSDEADSFAWAKTGSEAFPHEARQAGFDTSLPSSTGGFSKTALLQDNSGTISPLAVGSFAAGETGAFIPVGNTDAMRSIDAPVDDYFIDDADDSSISNIPARDDFGAPSKIEIPDSKHHRFLDGVTGLFSRSKKKHDDNEIEGWNDSGRSSRGSRNVDSWDDEDDWNGGGARGYGRSGRRQNEDVSGAVYSMVDRDLLAKEVWFVALGASSAGHAGMKAFLKTHAAELQGALFINLDAVGAGDICYLTREGFGRERGEGDHRMQTTARKAADEIGYDLGSASLSWRTTDATPAMARGFRAITLMGLDRVAPVAWRQRGDSIDILEPMCLERVIEIVTEMVRNG